MVKPLRWGWVVGFTSACVLSVAGCGSRGVPSGVAVRVGNVSIATTTVDHWMSIMASFSPAAGLRLHEVPDPPRYTSCVASLEQSSDTGSARAHVYLSACARRYETLKRQALRFLISSEWVEGEASALGVTLRPADLHRQVREFESRQAATPQEFRQFLARTGETMADVVLQAKVAGLTAELPRQVEQDGGRVSRAAVVAYYRANPRLFSVPQQRDLKILRLRTEAAAERAKREIQGGTSFAAIAAKLAATQRKMQLGELRHSEVEEASLAQPIDTREGLLVGLVPGFFSEKKINDAIFAARRDVLSGPLTIKLGYYVFEVKRIRPAHLQPLADMQRSIAAKLSAEDRQRALKAFNDGFRARWTARTDCGKDYTIDLCS